jgi:hypothetical protein
MNKNKSSISKAQSYEEIGEYWDTHDLVKHWEETKPAKFEIDVQSETTYYAVELIHEGETNTRKNCNMKNMLKKSIRY